MRLAIRLLSQPGTLLAEGFTARSLPEVFRFDIVASIAVRVVMMHVLLDGVPRRLFHF
jgi:hypothetical protein